MANPTVSLKHVPITRDEACGVCGAMFIAAEDSGSRVLTMNVPGQESFAALLCGGCHSKWSHGATVTFRSQLRA